MSYYISVNLKSFGVIISGPSQMGRFKFLSSSTNHSATQVDYDGLSRADALVEISKLLTRLDVQAVPCTIGDGITAIEADTVNRVNTRTILDSLCNAAMHLRELDVTKPVEFKYSVNRSGSAIIEIEVKEQVK